MKSNGPVLVEEPSLTNGSVVHEEEEEDTEDTNKPKSPLLTSHRLSTTSLDNVNLEEEEVDPLVAPKVPSKGIYS
jgi:hypothetical protein